MGNAKSAKAAAEQLQGNAPEKAPVVRAGMPSGYKVARILTLPVLVMKDLGEQRALQFIGPIKLSDVEGKKKEDGTREKPAHVAHVVDLDTGETLNFLVPTVVQSNIEKACPDESYVGRAFLIENMGKRKSTQRYVDYNIAELELEAE